MAEPTQAASRRALALLHPRRFFLDTWRTADREAQLARANDAAAARLELELRWVLVTACLCLTLIEYAGSAFGFADLCDYLAEQRHLAVFAALRSSPRYVLWQLGYWSGVRVLGYAVLPAIVTRGLLRVRLSEHGLRIGELRESAATSAVITVGALALVAVSSHAPSFQSYYPFYREAGRSYFDLGVWELLYAAQFFALELFFRGFLVLGCKRSLGSAAVFVAVVPYCMIHFGKPWPEALGAVIAGLVLGTLALRTRAITSGFVIHAVIALGMDLASLAQQRQWPTRLWP